MVMMQDGFLARWRSWTSLIYGAVFPAAMRASWRHPVHKMAVDRAAGCLHMVPSERGVTGVSVEGQCDCQPPSHDE